MSRKADYTEKKQAKLSTYFSKKNTTVLGVWKRLHTPT